MKNFLLILVLILLASCATKQTKVEVPTPEAKTEVFETKVTSKVFDYRSSLTWVKKLTKAVNCTINKESFAKRLTSVKSFDYSTHNGTQVYNNLINHNCRIRTYKTKNPFSNVIATTYTANTFDVYLNRRKNPRYPMDRMINTALHECLHNVKYGHGDNRNINNSKGNSVPNKVGLIAQQESKGCF